MLVVVGDAMGARDETNGDDARGKLGQDIGQSRAFDFFGSSTRFARRRLLEDASIYHHVIKHSSSSLARVEDRPRGDDGRASAARAACSSFEFI